MSENVSCFYREAPAQNAERLIIFVHGVLGGVATSWGAEAKHTSWPAGKAHVLAGRTGVGWHVCHLRYLSVGYLTPLLRQASNIHETALEQLSVLEHRKVFERYNEIHFIAHSMGGLVVKNILVALRARSELDKLRRVRSVTFLGTPAQGATAATFAAFFSSNPQFQGMVPAHLNEAIQMLEDDWRRLLQARGRGYSRYPRVRCAYETLPMTGIGIVVPREMATSDCDGDLQPMTLDHVQMAKAPRTDINPYLWTMGGVETVAKELDDLRLANGFLQEGREFLRLGKTEAARTSYTEAKILCRRADEVLGEADALRGLALVDATLGRNDEARSQYIQALSIYKGEKDRNGEAAIIMGIAALNRMLGRTEQARVGYIEAQNIYRALDDRAGEASVLFGLGELDSDRGQYDEARAKYDDARATFRRLNASIAEAGVLAAIAELELLRFRFGEARASFAEARRLYVEAGSRLGEAHVVFGLAQLDHASGNPAAARAKYQGLIDVYKAEGDRFGEANVLVAVAELDRVQRRFGDARARYSQSLRLYRALESRLGEANVLISLGRLSLAIGTDLEEARRYFYQAAALYDAIGMLQRGRAAEAEARTIPKK